MRYLPDGYAEVQEPEPGDRAAHPAGRDRVLQTLYPGSLRRVEQEKVVAPIREAKRRIPRQQREHDAHFEAQDNVEDYAELGCHTRKS